MRVVFLARRAMPFLAACAAVALMALGFLMHAIGIGVPHTEDGVTAFDICFPVPMDKDDVAARLQFHPEIPGSRIAVTTSWVDDKTLRVHLKESGYPKGQRIQFTIRNSRTASYFPVVLIQGEITPEVEPELLVLSPKRNVPTDTVFELQFNTVLDTDSFFDSVSFSVPGVFEPRKIMDDGKEIVDTSRWYFTPSHRLKNDSSYEFRIEAGLRSRGGVELPEDTSLFVTTAPIPQWIKVSPPTGSRNVLSFQAICFENSEELAHADVTVFPADNPLARLKGNTTISGKRVIFTPEEPFCSHTTYTAEVTAQSVHGEQSPPLRTTFESADLTDVLWVRVDVSTQKVHIYKGEKEIHRFTASTGTQSDPTPIGVYRINGRGNHFYSYRYGEGAYYWVRFLGNYLFHSVPVDKAGRIISLEAEKLGTPASHGCVRMSMEAAKWFFENIPDGTLVIIHGNLNPQTESSHVWGWNSDGSDEYLRVGLGSDPITVDPHDAADNVSQVVNSHLYETLVELTPDLEIRPLLAEQWQVFDNGKSWIFAIRPGVRFSDGIPLDAEAVARSFNRLLDPAIGCARRSVLSPYVESVAAVGPMEVQFILKKPLGSFLHHLTHAATAVIRETDEGIVGTGPFLLEEWIPGNFVRLGRNADYWGEAPRLEGISFVPVWDNAARVILLEGGELDVIYPVPPQDTARLQKKYGFNVIEVPSQRIIYMGMNIKKYPFDRKTVRQALNHAVDRHAIVKHLLFGLAVPLDSPLAPKTDGHCSFSMYSYDPQKAADLLAEAGIEPGLEVKLWTPVGRYPMDVQVAEAVAGYLNEVGLKARVVRWEWGSYLAKLREETSTSDSELDLYIMGWVPATGQAEWVLGPLLTTGSSHNESQYSNPLLDQLMVEVETLSGTPRLELLKKAQAMVIQDAPWIFLFSPSLIVAHRQTVEGITVHPLEIIDLARAVKLENRGDTR